MSLHSKGGVQLPNDVVSVGYRKTSRFEFAQVFHSKEHNFTGTEYEFIQAGLAYRFVSAGAFKRIVSDK